MKFKTLPIALITFFIGFTSCNEDDNRSDDEIIIENQAPNNFTVTVTPKEVPNKFIIAKKQSAKAIIEESIKNKKYEYVVTWTESIDPDGDKVVYTIDYDNKNLISNTTNLTYTISNEAISGKTGKQTFSISAIDEKGLKTTIEKSFDLKTGLIATKQKDQLK